MTRYDTAELNSIEFSSVASRLSRVVKQGANMYTYCPWHDDKHPSLLIGGRKGNFCHCFSCGKSGSVIDYVMAVKRCDFKEACEVLQEEFGIPYEEGRGSGVEGQRSGVEGQRSRGKGRGAKKKTDPTSIALLQKQLIQRGIRSFSNHTQYESDGGVGVFSSFTYPLSSASTFCECLRSIFTEEAINFVVEDYLLGCYQLGHVDGYVMFPSIDMQGNLHNVKIQRYCTDVKNPRFFHKEEKSTYWLGAILDKGKSYDCSCYFGMHLLAKYPNMPVVLVESPKNAVIGTLAFPDAVWIAVGNKNNLSEEKLMCLHGRKVAVIPDADALEEWKAKLQPLIHIAPFEFSSFCETVLQEQGKKGDVADYLIDKLKV